MQDECGELRVYFQQAEDVLAALVNLPAEQQDAAYGLIQLEFREELQLAIERWR